MKILERVRRGLVRIGRDLRAGRHLEAYSIFALGLALALLGVLDVGDDRWLIAGLLVGVSFLVFRTTSSGPTSTIGTELADRRAFPPFADVLRDATELWVYGPTANSILVNVADIRQHILDRAGTVRFIVQDPANVSTVTATKLQLDDNLDFVSALEMSIDTLRRLRASRPAQVTYGLLPMNPGFSLLVVNPKRHDGYVVLELQGFQDDNIADRMHVVINRAETGRWFDYWVRRFELMWNASTEQQPELTPTA